MQKKPYIVIMAGGIGSRFWPYSRNACPKQFLDILGTGRTLLQMTFDRYLDVSTIDKFFVVTNQSYFDQVREQLPELDESQILTEPQRRNTATCIAYATYKIQALDPEASMIVAPADHLITQEKKFHSAISKSLLAAEVEGRLITMGIKPNRPETGYGYIQYLEHGEEGVHKVKTFTEKPNAKLAKTFVESGDFVWNSGMFIWKAKSLVAAYEKYMPDVAEVFSEGRNQLGTEREPEFILKAYSLLKNISIDNGIMEQSEDVYVIPTEFGWSDLGSWNSLYELKEKDKNKNVVESNAVLYDTHNSYIKVDGNKLVVVQGLDNYLINETDNVLLICKLDAENKFREFVANAKKKGEDYV
ncbi:mannose-1-phosphate guanylyltransferase [Algoriphagus machipongonensis]|uniref:mannose-1-phosphate guanylyltransferase n=1 Tax=Algoriphagus machipongonensis TaxID=388413 RepID=A3I1E0_9BACT|nr:mannose-1-phosphate guanylyltransferase [Algoriphagus machipongonensis]EAZ79606.2 mannose-1-phosphate guanylyltransferase [Algoriphagus machipongonensis]